MVAYPANLTPGNLAYFLVVPTLIYQTSYPRSTRFRGRWLFLCAPCRARAVPVLTINLVSARAPSAPRPLALAVRAVPSPCSACADPKHIPVFTLHAPPRLRHGFLRSTAERALCSSPPGWFASSWQCAEG